MRSRLARCAVEAAAIRSVSGADHLANAHVRLAWEANALTRDEASASKFDPDQPEPRVWISAAGLAAALAALQPGLSSVFPYFASNAAFFDYATSPVAAELRRYRNAIVHRARPGYRDAPALGRTSRWVDGSSSLQLRPFDPEPDESLPTIAGRAAEVAEATG